MNIGAPMDRELILGTAENAAHFSEGRHPGVASAMAWLAYSHLPEELKRYARPFYEAAVSLLADIPTDSAELTTTLNRMVEAKDWAVRAGVRTATGRPGPMARPAQIVDPPASMGDRDYWETPAPEPSPLTRPIKDNPQA